MRTPLVVGNWKMHLSAQEAFTLARDVRLGLESIDGVDVGLAVPSVYLYQIKQLVAGSRIAAGAQNVHHQEAGAYTGEISAAMLAGVGCDFVIIGHSERRRHFAESDDQLAKKLRLVLNHQMMPILCVGETLEQREDGRAGEVVRRQLEGALGEFTAGELSSLAVAYEPVWAIGTGEVATAETAQQMHALIRGWLSERYGSEFADGVRLQYGGSVKPTNVAALASQPDIDGALVGGASLEAGAFCEIVRRTVAAKGV